MMKKAANGLHEMRPLYSTIHTNKLFDDSKRLLSQFRGSFYGEFAQFELNEVKNLNNFFSLFWPFQRATFERALHFESINQAKERKKENNKICTLIELAVQIEPPLCVDHLLKCRQIRIQSAHQWHINNIKDIRILYAKQFGDAYRTTFDTQLTCDIDGKAKLCVSLDICHILNGKFM